MRYAILLGAVLAIGIVAVVYFDQQGSGGTLEDSRAEAGARDRAADPPTVNPRREPVRTGPSDDPEPVDVRTEIVTSRPSVEVADGCRLRAVDKDSGEPIAGLDLHFLPQSAMPREGFMRAMVEHGLYEGMQETAKEFGTRFTTDERGEVVVPRARRGSMIIARTDDRFGMIVLRGRETEPIILGLEKLEFGLVQTVDASGKPLSGIPIAIVEERSPMLLWRGRTSGPEATVKVANPDVMRRQIDPDDADHPHTLRVVLGIPMLIGGSQPTSRPSGDELLDSPSAVTLVNDRFPDQVIRLEVPPTGRVVVDVGSPSDRDLLVELEPMTGRRVPMGAGAGHMWKKTEKGRAAFELVGLGVELELRLSDPLGEFDAMTTTVQAPMSRDAEVHVAMSLAVAVPYLVARIVDEKGEPIRNRPLKIVDMPFPPDDDMRQGPRDRSEYRINPLTQKTDAEGLFRLRLEKSSVSETVSGPLILAIDTEEDGKQSEMTRQGQVTISGPFTAGTTRLGDIVMEELPVTVSGRVVDDAGAPLAQVNLSMRAKVQEPRPWNSRSLHYEPGSRFVTGVDGRFVLRSSMKAGEVLLMLQHHEHLSSRPGQPGPLTAMVGARDLELVMVQVGSLQGNLLLDEGIVPLVVCLKDQLDQKNRWNRQSLRDGLFKAERLRPGLYSLEVCRAGRDGEVFFSIQDIEVKGGAPSADPRLKDIDLRGRVPMIPPETEFRVMVRDEHGEPLAGVKLPIYVGFGETTASTGADGTAILTARADKLSVNPSKDWYKRLRVELQPGPNEIVMERTFRIQVELDFASGIPGDQISVVFHLTTKPEEGTRRRGPDFALPSEVRKEAKSWSGLIEWPDPGSYRIDVTAHFIEYGEMRGGQREVLDHTKVPVGEPITFDLVAGDYDLTITKKYDKATLDAVKEQVR